MNIKGSFLAVCNNIYNHNFVQKLSKNTYDHLKSCKDKNVFYAPIFKDIFLTKDRIIKDRQSYNLGSHSHRDNPLAVGP